MKKCPTCEKEFDDAMRFCQTDGTPLVDAAPEVDPYKTMVAKPEDIAAMIPPIATASEPPAPASEEVLDLPPVANDPKKTMYASEDEIRDAMAEVDKPIVDIPPVAAPEPEPPTFIAPPPGYGDLPPSPDFSKTTPPIPSPFSDHSPEPELPVFEAPEPEPPAFAQADPTPAYNPFEHSAPAPTAPMVESNFTPTPAAQDQSWRNEPMHNPQYQPGSGVPQAAGQNQTLAIVSLVLGIAGLIFCLGVTGPPALITGIMAKKKASNNPAEYGGAGLALGGIITGILGTLLLLLVIAYFAFVFLFVGASIMAS